MSDSIFELKKEQFLEHRAKGNLADSYPKTHSCAAAAQLEDTAVDVKTAGRVVGLRVMGKILFAHIYDISGQVQIAVRKTENKPEVFESFVQDVALGDFIGVSGEMFTTKTGEKTIRVESWSLLNKTLRPMPAKWYGLEDIESRYRQRYLDIVVNEQSRDVFAKRIGLVRSMRRYLEDDGYMEVETPILQAKPSGATAKPFYTKHNALDLQCCLRIAPETYLKRCIGAGFDKVFEFARCFRNEGISHQHLQDFTMLEFYAAYWNADAMIKFVEGMFRKLINEVFAGKTTFVINGQSVDFSAPWPVYEYSEVVKKDSGIDIKKFETKDALLSEIRARNIVIEDADKLSWGNLVDSLYKKVSRPKLVQPCFLFRYPAVTAPLARRNAQDATLVDRFQFLVSGIEIVNAYSELVDPVDQRERLEEQANARAAGDDEAMPLDEDFLLAMEHGFPPICGVGIGIDRLIMILCGCENIKDTVLFPLLRPTN